MVGYSQTPILPSIDLKGMIVENEGMDLSSSRSVWCKAMRRRLSKRTRMRRNCGWNKRSKILMKKRAHLERSRRHMSGVERRVRTLHKLLPNVKSKDIDGLFMEAADYIVCLEMQVRVMQIMVKVLSYSNE